MSGSTLAFILTLIAALLTLLHKLLSPKPVTHLSLSVEDKMPFNPIARWTKSPSTNVNQYNVAWTLNGTAAGTGVVPHDPTADTNGYVHQFATDNPTVTLKDGDVVSVSVVADDTVNNLLSPAAVANLTLPITPEAPVNLTLTLT